MTITPYALDAVDSTIIDELTLNGRSPYSLLARKASINIATTRKRLRRLLQQDIISLEVIPHPGKLGYHTFALIGIHVHLRKLDSVLQELKAKSPVAYLSLTAGRYDILLWAVFKSPNALANFREKELSLIDGIEWSETMIVLKSTKTPWDRTNNSNVTTKAIDAIDVKIITALQKEPRITMASLVNKLQVSEPTIHQRMERLQKEGVIAISAITNPLKVGYQVAAHIGLRVHLSKLEEIQLKLAIKPNVRYVYQMAGRYDILFWVLFHTNQDLNEFIRHELAHIDGIEQSETFFNLDILKWSFRDFSPIYLESAEN